MAEFVAAPVAIPVPGGKSIEEFIGRVATGDRAVSIARMRAPAGWDEPAQVPDFDEYTLVLSGSLRVETAEGTLDVAAGQAVVLRAGERVRYSTPSGAEYVAVCLPAFAPDAAHRDDSPR